MRRPRGGLREHVTGLRDRWRDRSFRADRADRAVLGSGLRLQRQAPRLRWSSRRDRRGAAIPSCIDRRRARLARRGRVDTDHVCAVAVRSPVVRAVLVGHHRQAQVHRAPRRWCAAEAPDRTRFPFRSRPRRPGVLLHDRGLDDVELACVRACDRSDAGAVRRRADVPGCESALRSCRRGRSDLLRHVGEVSRRVRERRNSAGRHP